MNKTLRKELELNLVKTIEDVLSKQSAETAVKIRKTTVESSKTIAKKFYKIFKQKSNVITKSKPVKNLKTKTKAKTAVKKLKTVKKAKSKK
jgi:hypothetical protein